MNLYGIITNMFKKNTSIFIGPTHQTIKKEKQSKMNHEKQKHTNTNNVDDLKRILNKYVKNNGEIKEC